MTLLVPGAASAATNWFDTIPSTTNLDGGAGNWFDANWKATSNATSGAIWTSGNDAWFQPIAPLTNNLGDNSYTVGTLFANSSLGMIVLTNGSLTVNGINAGTGNSNLTFNLASLSIGAGGISNDNTGGSKVLALGSNATLTANQTWTLAKSGSGTIAGQVNLGGNALTLLNPYNTGANYLTANLIGNGNVLVTSTGGVASLIQFSGTNTYTGYTLVLGLLQFGNDTTRGLAVQATGVISNQGQVKLAGGGGNGTAIIGSAIVGTGLVNMAGSGNGFFSLTNANNYSGGTLISGNGLLTLSNDTALGTGLVTFNAAGRLSAAGTTARTLANNLLFISNGTIFGDTTQNGLLTLSGSADFAGAMRPLTISSAVIMSGVLSNGGFSKLGTGTLVVSNANNNYTLGTSNTGGALALGANNALGSGTLVMNGGTLQAADGTARTLTNAIVFVPGSNVVFGATGTGDLTLTYPFLDLGTGARTITVNGSTVLLQGALTNTAALVKAGSGTLVLSGANTYTGGTTNTAGMIALAGNNVLGGGAVVMNGGGLQAYDTTDRTVTNALVFAGTGNFGAPGTGNLIFNVPTIDPAGKTIAVSNGVTATFTGFTSTGGVTKAGAGTLVLENAAVTNLNFSGTSAGVLEVRSGSSILATAPTWANATLRLISNAVVTIPANLNLRVDGPFAMVISNNAQLILNGTTGDFGLCYNAGSANNSITVTSGGSLIATNFNNSTFAIGAHGTNAQLRVLAGGVFLGPTNQAIYLASAADSFSNSVLIAGSGTVWTNAATLMIGYRGSFNQVVVSNGAKPFSKNVSVGGTTTAENNQLMISDSGTVYTIGSALTVGANGAYNQLIVTNRAQVSADSLSVGFNNAAAISNLVVISDGAVLAARTVSVGPTTGVFGNQLQVLANGILETTSLTTSQTNNVLTNTGGVYQFTTNTPVVSAGALSPITLTGGAISFRGITNADVMGSLGSNSVKNILFAGTNTFRLNNASNFVSGAQNYTFAPSSSPSNYAGLEMINGGTAWRSAWLNIGTNGTLLVSNTTASVVGVLTNFGAITVANGTVSYLSNVVLNSGSSYLSRSGTNTFNNGAFIASGANFLADSLSLVTILGSYQNQGASVFSNLLTVAGGASYVSGGGSNQFSGGLLISQGGTFQMSNGISRVDGVVSNLGAMSVANSIVTYGGPVVISGLYASDPSTNLFTTNVTVTASGSLSGSNGDLFVFQKDFFMQSTNRSQFNLSSAAVLFTNGPTHTLSISNSGALDLGHFTNFAMVSSNFSIGTLSIAYGDNLRLEGSKGGGLTNALYVGWLDIQGWSTNGADRLQQFLSASNSIVMALTLTGNNLYYDYYDPRNGWLNEFVPDLGYELWGPNNGLLLPIPEPSPLLAVGAGLILLVVLRRQRLR